MSQINELDRCSKNPKIAVYGGHLIRMARITKLPDSGVLYLQICDNYFTAGSSGRRSLYFYTRP